MSSWLGEHFWLGQCVWGPSCMGVWSQSPGTSARHSTRGVQGMPDLVLLAWLKVVTLLASCVGVVVMLLVIDICLKNINEFGILESHSQTNHQSHIALQSES